MHAEHAIGRFLHGGFTRACRVMASRSCLASDFVVLVLSEAVLSETVLVLDGCLNCGNSDR
jgi:hypothetical protein